MTIKFSVEKIISAISTFFFSFLALYYLMLILAYFISKNGFRWKVYDEIEDIRAVNHETSKKNVLGRCGFEYNFLIALLTGHTSQ